MDWLSEFRVYVVNNEIRFIGHYSGNKDIKASLTIIKEAIKKLCDAGEGYNGFCIDFGVLSSGETALVEMNDGYSIGAYSGVNSEDYGDLIFSRWSQLRNSSMK